MLNAIIALAVVVLGLLGYGIKSTSDKRKLKDEVKELKASKEVLSSRMEKINEVRKELSLIESEKKPEKKTASATGDSTSRLNRLNKLSDKGNTSGE